MEAMLNFIPAPIAIALMLLGFVALAVGGIRLGYKATVKDLALELVEFLSTPSARRATNPHGSQFFLCRFLSTPSARRATAKTEKNISAFVSL